MELEHYSEHESALLNESHQAKRFSDDLTDNKNEEKKSKRKRRSSLASTRRSISGNIPSKDDYSSDLPSSYSSSASSQPQNENQKTLLKPNPLNIRMDQIIEEFEENISRLDQECAQWKMALKNLEKEQEQTKLLSQGNISISPDEIPQELKDFAKSEYMGDLIDFKAMTTRVDKGLLKSYFDIQKCLQDVKMFRGTVNTIKCHNKYVKASLSPENNDSDLDFDDSVDDDDDDDMDARCKAAGQPLLKDIKSQLEWMMKN